MLYHAAVMRLVFLTGLFDIGNKGKKRGLQKQFFFIAKSCDERIELVAKVTSSHRFCEAGGRKGRMVLRGFSHSWPLWNVRKEIKEIRKIQGTGDFRQLLATR